MSSRISLRSSGLTVFGARSLSVVTGLVFLLMITRSLTPAGFGLWEFIIDLVSFASYPVGIIAFWTTRRVARGFNVGKTSIYLSLGLSLAGLVFYLLSSLTVHSLVGSVLTSFLMAALLVPLGYWVSASTAVASGKNPQIVGYALVFSEACKIAVGFLMIVVLRGGLQGVIVAVEVSYFAQAALSSYLCRDVFGDRVELDEGRRWFVGSWVPAINSLSYVVGVADTFIISLVFSSTLVVGYYQAAFTVAQVVVYSSYLASGLYPLLLAGGSTKLPTVALDFSMLLGIPMAAGLSVLSRPVLFVLNPTYVAGAFGLVLLAFAALAQSVSSVLDSTLLGIETADTGSGVRHRELLRSNLALVPFLNFTYSLVYVVAIFLVLRNYSHAAVSQIVAYWGAIQLAVASAIVAVKVVRAWRSHAIQFPPAIVQYAMASIVMAGFALALSDTVLNYSSRLLYFSLVLISVVVLSAGLYFGIVYAVNARVRQNLKDLLRLGRRADDAA